MKAYSLKMLPVSLLSVILSVGISRTGAVVINSDTNDPPACKPGSCQTCPPAQKPHGSCGAWSAAGSCGGMPIFWISHPFINARIEDEPLNYLPALGPAVTFALSYRQRGAVTEDPLVFGVGPNWSCSFRAYVLHLSGDPSTTLNLHRGGSGLLTYNLGQTHPLDGSIMTASGAGYQVEYADGSVTQFQKAFTNAAGQIYYFMSSQADPQGNANTMIYAAPCCTDHVNYTNAFLTNCYFFKCAFDHTVLVNCCFNAVFRTPVAL